MSANKTPKGATREKGKAGRPKGIYSEWTPDVVETILTELAEHGNVTKATERAGIDRTSYYYHLQTDQEFFNKVNALQRAKVLAAGIRAIQVVDTQIDRGDGRLALDFLKLTDPAFRERTETTATVGLSLEEKEKAVRAAILEALGEDSPE